MKNKIKEVFLNIDEIHNKVNKTMDERKSNQNIADNTSFDYLEKEEINLNIIKKFEINLNLEEEINHLVEILKKRKSVRDYNEKPITKEDLMLILKYTFGYRKNQNGVYNYEKFPVGFISSTGGLAALTNYILVKNVQGLEKGLYRYNRDLNVLEQIERGLLFFDMQHYIYNTDFVFSSSFVVIIASNLEKMVWKYGERSYRYSHVDAGIAAHNMQLIATKNDIGSCMIAGFSDSKLKEKLELRKNEYPILMMSFGNYNK